MTISASKLKCLFVLLGFVACSSAAAEDGAWVSLRAAAECKTAGVGFEARVNQALVGPPARERSAAVRIERRGARYRASIAARDATQPLGTKRVLAASCEEAVAAALAVLAVALSTPAAPATVESVAEVPESLAVPAAGSIAEVPETHAVSAAEGGQAVEARAAADAAPLPGPERDPSFETAAPRGRFALRAGMDTGTLQATTAYVGVTVTWLRGPVEWRALLGFGLPYVTEEVDTNSDVRLREAFALFDLGGCYGWGDGWRFAACAAGELGLIQSAHSLNELRDEHTALRVSGVFGGQLGYRGSTFQPELELAAVAAAFGATEAVPLAFRASLGVGLAF